MSKDVFIEKDTLTAWGDAIREYTGESKLYTLDEMYEMLRPWWVQYIERDFNDSFEIPKDITSIGDYAFYNCGNLALTSLPEGITSIGDCAFADCYGLTNITFKGTPNSIGSRIFNSCTNLTTINVPWSEGEVAGAPWGAWNATINYNYTGE